MLSRSILIVTSLCLFAVTFGVGCGKNDGNQPATNAIGTTANTTNTSPDGGGDPRQPNADPKHPIVCIETSFGNITLQLDAEKAPLTVDNFLTYVESGYYDQTIIHQVYKGQGIIGGGFTTSLVEKPTRTPIRNEAHNGLKNARGTIAMVRLPDATDSATCQFFINVADNPALDYKDRTPEGYGYCVFGQVTEGMDIVDRINDAPVHDAGDFERTPVQPILVKAIRRVR